MAERREQVDVEDYMEEDRDYEMRQMERRQMLFREEVISWGDLGGDGRGSGGSEVFGCGGG
jgi:hypothetical protein